MRFRTLATMVGLGLLVAAGGTSAAVATASSASAHTPELSCSSGVVQLTLTNYPTRSFVAVVYDGNPDVLTAFGPAPFRWSKSVDLSGEHSIVVDVKGSDGQGNRTFAAHTTELCGYTPTPPVTTPPPTEQPTPPPTNEPTPPPTDEPTVPPVTEPPAPVVAPHVQDYLTCDGAAFVLDNTGSTVDVPFTITGKGSSPETYTVPAGQAVHTDANGDRFAIDAAPFTITAGEQTWTFDTPSDCASVPPTTEPTEPPVTTPPTDEPTEPPVTTPPTDDPTVPPTDEPTTPPTGEPTTPAPSDGPTTAPTGSPSPTVGTTPPASSPSATSSTTPTHGGTTAARAVDDTSRSGDLAYTGPSPWTTAWLCLGLATLIAGVFTLVIRRRWITRGRSE